MERFRAPVISQGRITIPESIRKKLGIEEGDYVQVEDIKKLVPKPNPKEEA